MLLSNLSSIRISDVTKLCDLTVRFINKKKLLNISRIFPNFSATLFYPPMGCETFTKTKDRNWAEIQEKYFKSGNDQIKVNYLT